jgi:hypothetical protein
MCVTCLGNNQHTHNNHTCSLAPLHNLSKKYCTHINIPYKHNPTRQTIKKGLFNNLGHSRYCDKRDMAKELWIVRYGFWELEWQDQMIGENWTTQNIVDVVFMLYQNMNRTWNSSC